MRGRSLKRRSARGGIGASWRHGARTIQGAILLLDTEGVASVFAEVGDGVAADWLHRDGRQDVFCVEDGGEGAGEEVEDVAGEAGVGFHGQGVVCFAEARGV